jgi:hypothetical protein
MSAAVLDSGINPARLKPLGITLVVLIAIALTILGVNLYTNPSVPPTAEERAARLQKPMEPIPPLPPEIERNVRPFGEPPANRR